MRISKSVLINSLAALVLVAAGYMLGQAFPANTATANPLCSRTEITGDLKMRQGDQVMVFVDGAQRMVHCGLASGCTAGKAAIRVNKAVRTSNGDIQYTIFQ